MKNWIIPVLVAAWAVAFFGSFLAFYLTPAKDFGLAAGWNKVGVLIRWQGVATILAIACLIARGRSRERRQRMLALVPVGGVVLILLAVGGLVIFANMAVEPPAQMPPKPVTSPVDSSGSG